MTQSLTDATEDQLHRYREEVIRACFADKEPPRLAHFLGRNSRTNGDVSRRVWQDYWDHVKANKAQAWTLSDYMRQTYKDTDTQLLFEKPHSTAADILHVLTGQPGGGLSFTQAGKKLDTKLRDRMSVAELAAQKMDEVFLNENKGDPRVMYTAQHVPLETAGYTAEPGTERLVQEALIKLFNVLDTTVTPRMVQEELNRRWSSKAGVFGRRVNTYVPVPLDPRTVPQECAENDVQRMHALFKRVAYGEEGGRIVVKEQIKGRLSQLNARELIDLEQYLHWMKTSLRHEISDGKLRVKLADMHKDSDLLNQINGEKDLKFEYDEPAVNAALRSRIMKLAREGAYTGMDISHIVPKEASLVEYPSANDPSHVFHVHMVAAERGDGPEVLTTRERLLYDQTKHDPLQCSFSDEDYVLAAASTAAFKRLGMSPDEAVDPDELITHSIAVLDAAESAEQRRALMAGSLAAHTSGSHGKPVLDITGPVLTVQRVREASQDGGGWDTISVRKVVNAARGLNDILNSKGKAESTHEVLERVFNTSDYMPQLKALVDESAKQIAANEKLAPFRSEISNLAAHTGIHDPFDAEVLIMEPSIPESASIPVLELELGDLSADVAVPVPVELYSPRAESESDSESDMENEWNKAENEANSDLFFDVSMGKAKTPYTTLQRAAAPVPAPVSVAAPVGTKRPFVPLSMRAKGLLAIEKPRDAINRTVVINPDEFKGCVVLQPAQVRTPGNTWEKRSHYMRVSASNMAEYKRTGMLTMDDGSLFRPADVLGATENAEVRSRIIKMGSASDPVMIPIDMALKEVPLKR